MRGLLIFCSISVISACSTQKKQTGKTDEVQSDVSTQTQTPAKDNSIGYSMGPVTIIYKTRNDYNDKVSVTLNDDKTKIVSYPGPRDVYCDGQLAYPTKLDSGYLLDNRGIGKNAAFLNLTLEEYSKQTNVFSLDDMMQMIIDKEPFIKMYNCGTRYQYRDIINDLNKIIDNKELNKFKRIL